MSDAAKGDFRSMEPLPRRPVTGATTLSRRSKMLIGLAVVAGLFMAGLIVARVTGLLRLCSLPTPGMSPTITPGDRVVMEGFTFLARPPRRGDIVVFKTDGIARLPAGELYVKRVVGEPGDRLRIANGKLFINDHQVVLSNRLGELTY